MSTLMDAQAQAYALVSPDVEFHSDWAIPKKWMWLKEQGTYLGVPIGPEFELDELIEGEEEDRQHQRAQVFTSGVVLIWRGGEKVDIK